MKRFYVLFLVIYSVMTLFMEFTAHNPASAAAASNAPSVGVPVSPQAQRPTPVSADAAGQSPANAPVTTTEDTIDIAEVNQYFDQMLDTQILDTKNVVSNPVGELLSRLPRYGMSFFRQPPSTYAPLDRVPVTSGYILGPDDELLITLWGMMEGSYNVTINRDGLANVPHVGAIRLAGYTLDEAKRALKSAFDQYFTDYQMNVAMGSLRSVTVYVTGDVRSPGAYTVSSFATLVNALLASGGPSDSGTLRRIELKRGGKIITTFDMYDLLLKGDKAKDIRLLPEDVIFVPPVGPLVGLAGEIRRPGVYELKGRTTVGDLLYLAGGMSAQTFKGRIQYYRIEDAYYRSVFEGSVKDLSGSTLSDGDVLRLFPVIDVPTVVNIVGPVGRPGAYGVVPGVTRVSELISQAGGLLVMASTRAELTRVTPTQNGPVTTRFQIDLPSALRGDSSDNMILELNDYLLVHIIPEWEQQRMVSISGEVMYPGTYAVIKGERISDLIRRCGGYTSRASLRGAVFTRASVAVQQRKELNRVADQLERDLLEASAPQGGDSSGSQALVSAELTRRRDLIEKLRDVDILGRVIVKMDVPDAIEGTLWDVELENGDSLKIPEIPSTVEVMGAVYATSSQVYNPRMGINDYINASGGYLRVAHKRMIYVLKADGTMVRLTRDTSALSSKKWRAPKGLTAAIEPGDTIVAPVKYSNRESLDSLKDVVDIIYKVAVAVGVILN
ncbi:MAG: SLBB domain-containing protein [Synergistaceae bacterium]|nr:SLBB domain-containing protein [Synergistaceae bacterium]